MAYDLDVPVTDSGDYFFISYNSEDKERVSSIVKQLHEKNIPMWYDIGIHYGDTWEEVIAEHIKHCKAVLLFFTEPILHKRNSYVRKEYKMATKYFCKDIYVIFLDEIHPKQVPSNMIGWKIELDDLQNIHYSNFPDRQRFISEICKITDSYHILKNPNPYIQLRKNVLMNPTGKAEELRQNVFGKRMSRSSIKTIHFLNTLQTVPEDAWDVSEAHDRGILAWIRTDTEGWNHLYLAADGVITANRNCTRMFYEYENLENIIGLEYLDTEQTVNMSFMFLGCESLRSVDVSHFNTSNVTTMFFMFRKCKNLQNVDVSHFDTSNVTNVFHMFFGCNSLKNPEQNRLWAERKEAAMKIRNHNTK